MVTLCISLLGGLRMALGDKTLPSPTPLKLVSLLACLLLYRERPVSRHQIADWLWPDEADGEARANLRRHLHLLRSFLPPGEWVLAERDTVQWNPAADYWLDVAEFTRSAAKCMEQHTDESCESCFELYQGDLLPEVYDDWLIPEREALRGQFVHTLEAAVTYFSGRGDHPAALRYARRLLAFDPLHEETHRTIMHLHYQLGDRQAALNQYEACESALRRELDVAPMPATLELHRAILEGRPLSGAALASPKAAIPQPEAAPLAEPPLAASPDAGRGKRRPKGLAAAIIVVLALAAVTIVLASAAGFRLHLSPPPPESLVISGPTTVKDTWITETYPDDLYWPDDPDRTPHEKYSRAHLQFFGQSPTDRILVQFDLGPLPANVQVEQATFGIHLETWIEFEGTGAMTQSYPAEVGVFQILTPWQAEQATFNQPWTQPGLQPGVDYEASPLDTFSLDDTIWLEFDVTDVVLGWLSDPSSNHGLMIEIIAAPQDKAHYWVDLTDQGTATLRPYLQISYRKP
jgi:DNA-binding SARP family transcriptional activator